MLSLVLITITSITLTLSHPHKGKIHKCASHKQNIIKGVNLHEINVPYFNHPYANPITSNSTESHSHRRSLLTQSETAPIRIRAYYDPLTVNTNELTTEQILNLKSTIGAIVNYYQQMVRVIPINGTFFWERHCTLPLGSRYGIDCTQYSSAPRYCQHVQIPDDHLGLSWDFHYPTDEGVTRLGPGRGISDADLVLYVSADDTTSSCSGSTLAHAGPCLIDQYGRPIAGNINVCASFFSDHEWKKDTETMLHELSHITVMLKSLWSGFRDSNGIQRQLIDVFDETKLELRTPLLLQTVRNHFNCQSVTGLPLHNASSFSHWNERYVFSENMNPIIYTQQMFYSKFTLALMEDSGWYLPNFEYAEPYYFGQDAGCKWFTDDCINKTTHISNFPTWYCDNGLDDGCNQDNSAPGNCFYYNYDPPTQFQYFTDIQKGGSPYSDYCPWIDPSIIKSPDYESVCWDIRGNNISFDTKYMAEIWGKKSRCTKIIATNGQSHKGYCFQHECLNWDGSKYNSVNIIFSNTETITCNRNDKLTTKILISVSNRQLTCPDIDIVCGINTNFDMCYFGHYSDIEGKCICNPGYIGINCNIIDDSTNVDAISGPVFIEPIWDNLLCIDGFINYPNFNGAWIYVQTYEYLPAYYISSESKYLWWHFWDHRWYINDAIGDTNSNPDCRCDVSYFTQDLTLCNGNWKCGSNTQLGSSSSYGLCPGVPTLSPTTKDPTTYNPTTYDPTTYNPTTYNPTTYNPTTAIPTTYNPTAVPTTSIPTTTSPTPLIPTTALPTTMGPTTNNPTTSSPTTNIPTTNNPTTNTPTTNNPTQYPTKYPTNNPSTATPTNNPSTKYPTEYGYTYPPSFDPTKYPSVLPSKTPSKNPTILPSKSPIDITSFSSTSSIELFMKDIVISLQYEIEQDKECDNTTNLVNIIEIFTNQWIDDLEVSIDSITLINDEINEKIFIKYITSAISKELLDELNSIIISRNFKKELINRLDDQDEDKDCFIFLDVFVTTVDQNDKNDMNDGINIFDYENYGTTEILILILAGLILLSCLWLCIWLVTKNKQGNREKNKINTIEFGGNGITRKISQNKQADELFEQALTMTHQRKYSNKIQHVMQETPSDIPLPHNTGNDYVASGDEGFDI